MATSCEIPSVDLIEEFNATEFHNTRTIRWMHGRTPRFGHSNDLLQLMQGSDIEQKDYLRGLISSSLAMFCFFCLWMLFLLICRCMGPYEVGFLSGRLRPLPPKPSPPKQTKGAHENPKEKRSQNWMRINACGKVSAGKDAQHEPKAAANSLDELMEWEGKRKKQGNNVGDNENAANDRVSITHGIKEWEEEYRRTRRLLRRLSVLACFCGMAIVISSCFMAKNGVNSLTNSLNDSRRSVSIARALTTRAMELIDAVAEQNLETGEAVDELLEDINMMCPNMRPDGLCTDINDVSTCDFDDIMDDTILITTIKHFKDAEQSIYYQDLISARQDLEELENLLVTMDDTAIKFNWALYCSVVGSMIMAGLCLLILFGVICPTWRLLDCLRHWFIVPAFSMLVIFAFLFALVFVLGSMAVADLCYDSPDTQILIILNRFSEQLSPLGVQIVSFYINGCPQDAIPQEISTQIDFVLDTIPMLGDFSTMVKGSTNELQKICGFEDPSTLGEVADLANVQLCEIVDILNQIRLFFQCENWFPLYESTMYNAVCYNGTEGFAWVAVTQFVIVFFSCMLLTLRAAFHRIEIEDAHEEKDTEKPLDRTETNDMKKQLVKTDADDLKNQFDSNTTFVDTEIAEKPPEEDFPTPPSTPVPPSPPPSPIRIVECTSEDEIEVALRTESE